MFGQPLYALNDDVLPRMILSDRIVAPSAVSPECRGSADREVICVMTSRARTAHRGSLAIPQYPLEASKSQEARTGHPTLHQPCGIPGTSTSSSPTGTNYDGLRREEQFVL